MAFVYFMLAATCLFFGIGGAFAAGELKVEGQYARCGSYSLFACVMVILTLIFMHQASSCVSECRQAASNVGDQHAC